MRKSWRWLDWWLKSGDSRQKNRILKGKYTGTEKGTWLVANPVAFKLKIVPRKWKRIRKIAEYVSTWKFISGFHVYESLVKIDGLGYRLLVINVSFLLNKISFTHFMLMDKWACITETLLGSDEAIVLWEICPLIFQVHQQLKCCGWDDGGNDCAWNVCCD